MPSFILIGQTQFSCLFPIKARFFRLLVFSVVLYLFTTWHYVVTSYHINQLSVSSLDILVPSKGIIFIILWHVVTMFQSMLFSLRIHRTVLQPIVRSLLLMWQFPYLPPFFQVLHYRLPPRWILLFPLLLQLHMLFLLHHYLLSLLLLLLLRLHPLLHLCSMSTGT